MIKNRFIVASLLLSVVVSTNYTYQYSCVEIGQLDAEIQKFIELSSKIVAAKTRAGKSLSQEFQWVILEQDEIMQKTRQVYKSGLDNASFSAVSLKKNVTNGWREKGKDLDRQIDAYAYRERMAKVALGLGTVCVVGGIVALASSDRGSLGQSLGGAGAVVGGTIGVGGGVGWYLYNSEAQSDALEHRVQVTCIENKWKDTFEVLNNENK